MGDPTSLLKIYGPAQPFVTHTEDKSLAVPPAARTFHGHFFATFAELFSLFGPPLERPDSRFTTEWGLRFDDGAQLWIVDCRDSNKPRPSGAELRVMETDTLYEWDILADHVPRASDRVHSVLFVHRMAERGVDATAMGEKEGIFHAIGKAFSKAMRLPVPAARLHAPGDGRGSGADGAAASSEDVAPVLEPVSLPQATLPRAIAFVVAKWKPLRFHTHNEDASLAVRRGTLQATMGAPAWALMDLFGPPIRHEGAHITLEWGVRFENGSCVWIHDWDATSRANPRRLSPEDILGVRSILAIMRWRIVCEERLPAQKLLRSMSALSDLCARGDGHTPTPVDMQIASGSEISSGGASGSAASDGDSGAANPSPC